jgi:hypothetical protein
VKLRLSEKASNGPEREFFRAIDKKLDENPDMSFSEAVRLVASENRELERNYLNSRPVSRD